MGLVAWRAYHDGIKSICDRVEDLKPVGELLGK
jgi:hypothetical protein